MNKIKEHRKLKGMTQDDLAKALGVSHGVVSQYESGVRQPKLEQLKKIANVLGVSYLDLIDDDEYLKQYMIKTLGHIVENDKEHYKSWYGYSDGTFVLMLNDEDETEVYLLPEQIKGFYNKSVNELENEYKKAREKNQIRKKGIEL